MQDGQDDGRCRTRFWHAEWVVLSAGGHAQAGQHETHVLEDPFAFGDSLGSLLNLGDVAAALSRTPVREGVPDDVAEVGSGPLLAT